MVGRILCRCATLGQHKPMKQEQMGKNKLSRLTPPFFITCANTKVVLYAFLRATIYVPSQFTRKKEAHGAFKGSHIFI